MKKSILISLIEGYQKLVSPLFGRRCRFYPTCSQYAIDSIKKHGACVGLIKAVIRIVKCNPLHPGGYDPA